MERVKTANYEKLTAFIEEHLQQHQLYKAGTKRDTSILPSKTNLR